MLQRKNRTEPKRLAALFVACCVLAACAHENSRGAHEVTLPGFTPHTSQIELQQSVERYATVFVERVGLEFELLIKLPETELADNALRLYVRYASSALEIASGQQPEVNVLDLLVFVMLTRASVEQYWIPHSFGERARPVLKAMQASEVELWTWAQDVLADDKREQLHAFVARWLEAHPAPPRVEWIRFAEFASVSADVDRSRAASGILSSVRAATRTADTALLMSERALFMAQRAPSLLRVQARLGAREMFADGVQRLAGAETVLEHGDNLLRRTEAMRPLVQDLQTLSNTFAHTLTETRTLTAELQSLARLAGPLLSTRAGADGDLSTGIEQLVISAQGLSESTRQTMTQAHELAQAAGTLTREGSERIDRLLRKLVAYAIVVGILCSAIFWTGYVVVCRYANARSSAARD